MASNSDKKDIEMKEQPGDDAGLTFWGHLEVLRWALVRVAVVVLVAMVGWFIVMPDIFKPFVLGPTTSDFFLYKLMGSLGDWIPFMPDFSNDQYHVDIININVASQFMTHISTSFWFSLVTAFPYLIFEIWRFIRPALYDNEKGSIGLAFFFGTLFTGGSFGELWMHIVGWAVIAVIAAFIAVLIIRNNKKMKDEKKLVGKANKKEMANV
jgi:Sec-independent protein secretion pathway component TatC